MNVTLLCRHSLQVLKLLEEQLRRVEQRIDALLLVGGFSGSEYLYTRVNVSWIKFFRLPLLLAQVGNIGHANAKRANIELDLNTQ